MIRRARLTLNNLFNKNRSELIMSFLKGKILGSPSGRTGDIVFKSLNHQTIICSAPTTFRTPTDPASVARRSHFRLVIKLSAAIIKLLSIKVLWKKTAPAGQSVFNQLIQKNYPKVNATGDISQAVLCSSPGFVMSGPEVVISASGVTLSADPLGNNSPVKPAVEKKISAEGVLLLSDPLDKSDEAYVVIPLSSDAQDVSLTAPLSFTMNLSEPDVIAAAKYSTKKAVVTLVTLDQDSAPVRASVTAAG
jgi:hypothetical protein